MKVQSVPWIFFLEHSSLASLKSVNEGGRSISASHGFRNLALDVLQALEKQKGNPSIILPIKAVKGDPVLIRLLQHSDKCTYINPNPTREPNMENLPMQMSGDEIGLIERYYKNGTLNDYDAEKLDKLAKKSKSVIHTLTTRTRASVLGVDLFGADERATQRHNPEKIISVLQNDPFLQYLMLAMILAKYTSYKLIIAGPKTLEPTQNGDSILYHPLGDITPQAKTFLFG